MNWIYKGKEITSLEDLPDNAIGFIYKIYNITLDRFYIGKKSLFSTTNPEISKKRYLELKQQGEPVKRTKNKRLSKKGKPVWRYKRKDVKTETNWKSYNGSNEELIRDIKRGDKVRKEILTICTTSKELTYQEVKQQFLNSVLERCDSYNNNILGSFYSELKCE